MSFAKNPKEISGIFISKVLCFVGDTSIETAGLQTLTVDVNHIHKARYGVQLPFVSTYTCLKEAIFVGGRTFFIYFYVCVLDANHEINFLVFIRPMRERQF